MQAGLLEQASKSLSGFRLPNPIRKFFRFSPMGSSMFRRFFREVVPCSHSLNFG